MANQPFPFGHNGQEFPNLRAKLYSEKMNVSLLKLICKKKMAPNNVSDFVIDDGIVASLGIGPNERAVIVKGYDVSGKEWELCLTKQPNGYAFKGQWAEMIREIMGDQEAKIQIWGWSPAGRPVRFVFTFNL